MSVNRHRRPARSSTPTGSRPASTIPACACSTCAGATPARPSRTPSAPSTTPATSPERSSWTGSTTSPTPTTRPLPGGPAGAVRPPRRAPGRRRRRPGGDVRRLLRDLRLAGRLGVPRPRRRGPSPGRRLAHLGGGRPARRGAPPERAPATFTPRTRPGSASRWPTSSRQGPRRHARGRPPAPPLHRRGGRRRHRPHPRCALPAPTPARRRLTGLRPRRPPSGGCCGARGSPRAATRRARHHLRQRGVGHAGAVRPRGGRGHAVGVYDGAFNEWSADRSGPSPTGAAGELHRGEGERAPGAVADDTRARRAGRCGRGPSAAGGRRRRRRGRRRRRRSGPRRAARPARRGCRPPPRRPRSPASRPSARGDARRQRARAAGDAHVGAADAPLAHQRGDDARAWSR